MVVYIDAECKCHLTNDGTMRAFEVPDFDGKCKDYIEGMRFLPLGETMFLPSGAVFNGEMISPWKNFNILMAYQAQYESMLPEIRAREDALAVLGVTADD